MLAREVISLHSACPERRRRAHLPVPKTLASNSRGSITYKLIQNKRLQVYCFGHLQKTGGWGSIQPINILRRDLNLEASFPPAPVLAEGCRLMANGCLLSPFPPLHTQKRGGYTPSKMSARRHFRFFPIYSVLSCSPVLATRHSPLATRHRFTQILITVAFLTESNMV